MKKILSFVLAAVMMLSMAVPSFAADMTSAGSENVVVSYGVDGGFVVTIPASVSIDSTGVGSCQISAENVVIAANHTLQVRVGSNDYNTTGSWELVDAAEASNTLTYTIGKVAGASDVTNGTVVLAVNAGDSYNNVSGRMLHFSVVDELTKAGTYTDTLTFTVNVVNNLSQSE